MNLVELKIKRVLSGPNKGQHIGLVKFDNSIGSVGLKLNSKLCEEIFLLCAEGAIIAAEEAADELHRYMVEHKATIEEGKEDESAT